MGIVNVKQFTTKIRISRHLYRKFIQKKIDVAALSGKTATSPHHYATLTPAPALGCRLQHYAPLAAGSGSAVVSGFTDRNSTVATSTTSTSSPASPADFFAVTPSPSIV